MAGNSVALKAVLTVVRMVGWKAAPMVAKMAALKVALKAEMKAEMKADW